MSETIERRDTGRDTEGCPKTENSDGVHGMSPVSALSAAVSAIGAPQLCGIVVATIAAQIIGFFWFGTAFSKP